MAGNAVTLTFAGDAKSLDRAFDQVGKGAKDMASDLHSAEKDAGRFSAGIGKMNEKVEDSESKFMGAADLVDGLSSAMGISLGPAVDYARAFGDIAGGFSATLGPAMEGVVGKLGKLTFVTKVQAGAQAALNAVMEANPIFLVVGALALLTAGFILAYKKSETFRDIVNGALGGVRDAISWVGDKAAWLVDKIVNVAKGAAKAIGKIAEIITAPYRLAFNGIADLWNNTVGSLSFKIPGWVPGIGGSGFDVPDIPHLARGGTAHAGQAHLVGESGPELFVPGMTGTVVPNGGFGGGVTVQYVGAEDKFMSWLREAVRVRGGNVQNVLGT